MLWGTVRLVITWDHNSFSAKWPGARFEPSKPNTLFEWVKLALYLLIPACYVMPCKNRAEIKGAKQITRNRLKVKICKSRLTFFEKWKFYLARSFCSSLVNLIQSRIIIALKANWRVREHAWLNVELFVIVRCHLECVEGNIFDFFSGFGQSVSGWCQSSAVTAFYDVVVIHDTLIFLSFPMTIRTWPLTS